MASLTLRAAAIGTFALILAGVPTHAVELQPGLWEILSRSQRDRVVTSSPTRTKCITPEQAKTISKRAFLTAEFRLRGQDL